MRWGSILRSIAPSLVFNLLTISTVWASSSYRGGGGEGFWVVSTASVRAWGAGTAIDTVVLTPCREEIVYRGIVLGRLLRRLPAKTVSCCFLSSALFAVVHLKHAMDPRFGPTYTFFQVLLALAAGFLFGLMRLNQKGSLWGPCLCHVLNNATASLLSPPSTGASLSVATAVFGNVVFYAWRIRSELNLARRLDILPKEG